LAQELKRRFLCSCLFGLEPAQQFIAGDDGEGETVVFGKIGPCSLDDERVLFEEFGEDVGIQEDWGLGHYAAGSRKKCRRSKAMVSTCRHLLSGQALIDLRCSLENFVGADGRGRLHRHLDLGLIRECERLQRL
jgi:hypothetical protein